MLSLFIEKILFNFGNEDVRKDNIFYRNKNSILFYLIIFALAVGLHIFIEYIQFNDWYCRKVCDLNTCKVICELPLNGFTNFFITT